MKHLYLLFFVIVITARLQAQVTLTSSNLPIVILNTNGQTIPDEPKINATMSIINNAGGSRNNVTDAPNEYNGNIGIEVRGQSSQMFPMKSYSIELRDAGGEDMDQSIFGLPEESDWVLYAPYTDKTLMRNVLTYEISNVFGQWAAHTKYVEVLLNGQYQGVYVFMEKIKRDKDRVNIKKLEPEDNTPDKITGGYIYSIDKNADAWYSQYPALVSNNAIHFKYEYPKTEDITDLQKAYIKSYSDSFETALKGANFQDTAKGFRHFADEGSFIDYFIINELSRNVDGYRISTFLHKDRDDVNRRIIMGPVWDYDLAFRNADYCNGSNIPGWAFRFNDVCPDDGMSVPFWWNRFMQDTAFEAHLLCRWKQVRQTTLSVTNINRIIDSVAVVVNEAQQRHFTQWPILGTYVWPNPYPIPATYPDEISTLKNWIAQRLAWLDANLPKVGACSSDVFPVHLLSFSGTGSNGTNYLQWTTAGETAIAGYEIQYSLDGSVFTKSGYVTAAASLAAGNTYHFNHTAVGNGSMLYRIKVISADGGFSYSSIIIVVADNNGLFTISPNPGNGKFVIKGDATLSSIRMKVMTAEGRQLGVAQGNVVSLSNLLSQWLQSKSAGLYVVQLYNGNAVQTIKLMMQ